HRDPPGGSGPEHQREAFNEWEQLRQQIGLRGVDREHRAGERGNGNGPHVNPVGRAELRRLHSEKRVAVEDQADDPDVEHSPAQPDGEAEKNHGAVVRLKKRGKLRAQDGNGLRRHDGGKPAAVDPGGNGGFVDPHRQGGKDGVGEDDPEPDAEEPQARRQAIVAADDLDLAAQHAGGGDGGEERQPAGVADQVGPELPRVQRQPQQHQNPDDDVEADVEPEEHEREAFEIEQVAGGGDDAGGHYHGEVRRVHAAQAGFYL